VKGLAPQIEELKRPHADEHFPFELFRLVFDFSHHTDEEIVQTIRKIMPELMRDSAHRIVPLIAPIVKLVPHVADFSTRPGAAGLSLSMRFRLTSATAPCPPDVGTQTLRCVIQRSS